MTLSRGTPWDAGRRTADVPTQANGDAPASAYDDPPPHSYDEPVPFRAYYASRARRAYDERARRNPRRPAGPDPRTGLILQFVGEVSRELDDPAQLRPGQPAGEGPPRLAGQILPVADDEAAAIGEASRRAAAIRQQAFAQAAAMRQQASAQAAAMRQQASAQAAAIRQAAEQEAAGLRSDAMALSAELGRVAAYVSENLAAGPVSAIGPAARAPGRRAIEPVAELAGRPWPASRPRGRPVRPPALVVRGLSAKSGGKPRLTDMSFVQRQNHLLAIVGPSGAGKTSLFSALVGELALEHGDLYFGELPLRTHGAQIREQLGFVPQDEHLFRNFTVGQLLRYSFELRIAGSTARRDECVAWVCEQLKISGQVGQLIGTLSGGQRKRVSIAVELLSEPTLLMLDEPTSGLDAGMDREILEQLREYAGRGMTVILSTHSTEHLELADRVLVVAPGGRPAYFGPPDGVLAELGVPTFAALMDKLITDPDPAADAYQAGYAASEADEEARRVAWVPPPSRADATGPGPAAVGLRQFQVLVRRQADLIRARGSVNRSDAHHPVRRLAGFLTVLAPLVISAAASGLAALVSGHHGLGPGGTRPGPASAATALSLLITLSVLAGQALTYSDIVNEFPAIRREHRTGTLVLPVLMSKWLVFAGIAVLQALVITWSYLQIRPGPAYSVAFGPVVELLVDLAAVNVAAMTLGLLISASLPRLDQAIMAVTAVSIAQITLNGIVSTLSGPMNLVSLIFPSRWGVAAAAASVNLRRISPGLPPDAMWRHTTSQWFLSLFMLGVLTGVYFLLAHWQLTRRLNRPD
jgi:ABC-type glutathione transport system ATPase component